MKKVIFILLAIFSWTSAAWAGVGFIAGVQGESHVARASESLPATVGMAVELGDRLVTGKKARIKILFSDDSLLTVGGKTELIITEHLFDAKAAKRQTIIELIKGKLRALVQKDVAGISGTFEVHTKNAVAGVRGTEFVIAARNDRLRLWTISGSLELTDNHGQKKLVAAGEGCEVRNGVALAPHALALAELRKVRSQTDVQQSPQALALNFDVGSRGNIGNIDRVKSLDRIQTREAARTTDKTLPSDVGGRLAGTQAWNQQPEFIPTIENINNLPGTTFSGNGVGVASPSTHISTDGRDGVTWFINHKDLAPNTNPNVILRIKIPK